MKTQVFSIRLTRPDGREFTLTQQLAASLLVDNSTERASTFVQSLLTIGLDTRVTDTNICVDGDRWMADVVVAATPGANYQVRTGTPGNQRIYDITCTATLMGIG